LEYLLILLFIILALAVLLINITIKHMFHLKHVSNIRTPKSLTISFTEHKVKTENNCQLQMWEFNKGNREPVLLFIHGWANAADSFFPMLENFNENWNIYLLNTRNHGGSDSSNVSSIIQFKEDIIAAVDHILAMKSSPRKIFLVGHSLGAAASLLTASVDNRICGVISIASFSNMERFMYKWEKINNLPESLIKMVIRCIEFRLKYSFSEISPDHTIGQFQGPVMIIHGTQDKTVHFTALTELFNAANRKNVEVLKLKLHTHSSMLQDKQMPSDIQKFILKHI